MAIVNSQYPYHIKECGSSEAFCRICYSDENSRELELISPCDCKGSIQHIHRSCLLKWVSSGLALKKAGTSIECEICKAELPLQLNRLPIYHLFSQPFRGQLFKPFITLCFHFGALQIFRKLEWKLIQALQTKSPRNFIFRVLDCFSWHLFGPFRYQLSLFLHLILVYRKKRSIKQLFRHSAIGGVFCFIWTLFFFYFHVVLKKGLALWNQIVLLRRRHGSWRWRHQPKKCKKNLMLTDSSHSFEHLRHCL